MESKNPPTPLHQISALSIAWNLVVRQYLHCNTQRATERKNLSFADDQVSSGSLAVVLCLLQIAMFAACLYELDLSI